MRVTAIVLTLTCLAAFAWLASTSAPAPVLVGVSILFGYPLAGIWRILLRRRLA